MSQIALSTKNIPFQLYEMLRKSLKNNLQHINLNDHCRRHISKLFSITALCKWTLKTTKWKMVPWPSNWPITHTTKFHVWMDIYTSLNNNRLFNILVSIVVKMLNISDCEILYFWFITLIMNKLIYTLIFYKSCIANANVHIIMYVILL